MSKDKKLIPELRFPEFVDKGEWEEKKLFQICEKISQGGTPDTANSAYWNGCIEWITPAEMGKVEDKYVYSTVRKITEAGLKNCSSDLIPINSVILSTRAPIGHLVINKSEMAMNQGCKGLIPNKKSNFEYLFYCISFHKNLLSDLGAGNTFKELSASSLKSFEILIPSNLEQQKIASCLSSLDEVIAAHTQKLELLKGHKKGLMQNLFPQAGEKVPRSRFFGFEKDGEWVEKTLDEVATISKGKGISKADINANGNLPCIRYGELYTHYNETIDTVKSYTNLNADDLVLSKANDVIIPASGETQIDIATASCVLESGIALGGDLNIIRSKMNGVFLSYYLNNAKKHDIAQMAQGISVIHLYPNQLKTLQLQIPKPEEQQKIASCLSSLDANITAQAEKITQLKLHKKGLMQGLFPRMNTA